MTDATIPLLAVIGVAYAIYRLCRIGRRDSDLPPGPPTLPVLGNILDFPTRHAHFKFTEWSKTYGEIFSLKIAGETMVVLNSGRATRDVLDSKGNALVTADRPALYVPRYLYDGMNIPFSRYGTSSNTFGRPNAPHSWLFH